MLPDPPAPHEAGNGITFSTGEAPQYWARSQLLSAEAYVIGTSGRRTSGGRANDGTHCPRLLRHGLVQGLAEVSPVQKTIIATLLQHHRQGRRVVEHLRHISQLDLAILDLHKLHLEDTLGNHKDPLFQVVARFCVALL